MPLKTWPKPFKYFKDVKKFFFTLSAIITFFFITIFLFLNESMNALLIETVRDQADSYANLIIATRNWNSRYGGVYVEKKKGVEANPYFDKLGIQPDVKTADGRTFTLRNPAIMTREISELTNSDNSVQFHMISLKYLNPDNAPDPFERQALEQFESSGVKEVWTIDRSKKPTVFRYVRPLRVEEPCLGCHRRQGYALGGIRGGISVNIPADTIYAQMSINRLMITSLSALTIGLLIAILYFLTWKLVVKLDDMQKHLKKMAVTDELTGLSNRRYIMDHLEEEYQRAKRSGEPLSLIMLDIDHFKRINDSHGHAFGDIVLKKVASDMKAGLRPYDLLGRIGGEEFLIASPGSTLDEAAGLARRIIEKIKSEKIHSETAEARVTISAGVTSLNNDDGKAETVLIRADEALYRAKQEGRDRVVVI